MPSRNKPAHFATILLAAALGTIGCGGTEADSGIATSPSVSMVLNEQGDLSLGDPGTQQVCNPEVTEECGGGGGGTGGGGLPYPDLNPFAPGYWLGYNTGPGRCYSTLPVINDVDHDDFDDWCEELISSAFRPLLRYSPYDCNTGKEPYWALHYFPAEQRARVIYLLSYYTDCGTPPSIVCQIPWIGRHCDGHEGDSEWISIEIDWDPASNHWVVRQGFLSAHFGEEAPGADASMFLTNPEWVNKVGGYFRVWVARGKHGNYESQDKCNGGGIAGLDTCEGHSSQLVEERLFHAANRNVGSNSVHLIDCVVAVGAQAPFREGTECYWTAPRFVGWYDYAAHGGLYQWNSATSYGDQVLTELLEDYTPLGWFPDL